MSGSGDYIPREEAEKRLSQRAEIANSAYIDQTPCQIMMLAQNVVHLTPAADVRPVVKAAWEDTPNPQWPAYDIRHCPCCGWSIPKSKLRAKDLDWNYCPNCGADMREES